MTGLKIGDFEVYEDGVRQKITSLEEVIVPTNALATSADVSASGTETASGPPDPSAVFVALVFEELGPAALRLSKFAASSFLSESIAPQTYVGVFVLDRAVHTVSPYTKNRSVLSNALQTVGMHPGRPIERAGDVPGAEYSSRYPGQATPSTAEDNQFIRGHATLNALDAVVRSLETYPGRKAIVLFSEGLALGVDPQGAGTPDSALTDSRWDHLLRVVDRANRSYIAFYTFDAGGLRAQNPSAAARYSMGLSPFGIEPYVGLETIALETGGRYSGNTNDLANGLKRMGSDLRQYYLLSYAPLNVKADAKYRHIEVKVARRGVSALYRKGYRAVDDSTRNR